MSPNRTSALDCEPKAARTSLNGTWNKSSHFLILLKSCAYEKANCDTQRTTEPTHQLLICCLRASEPTLKIL